MLAQRVVLVTGGNRGIGYEAVKLLSQRLPNDVVYLSSRSSANGEAAVNKMQQEVTGHSFENVRVIELDITKKTSLDAAVDKIRSEQGQLTDLVHNSAIAYLGDDTMTPEILEVNVRHARNTIEAFLPIIPAKTGRISLVSSIVGAWYNHNADSSTRAKLDDVANNDWPTIESYINDWAAFAQGKPDHKISWLDPKDPMNQAYCVSKAILTAWARNFAQTHPNYPLAIVCPGYCATELNHNSGTRPASDGAASIVWPLFNQFETGHFYQDGNDMPFASAIPEGFFA